MFDKTITIQVSETDLRNIFLALKVMKDHEKWPFVIKRSCEKTLIDIEEYRKFLPHYTLQQEEDRWKRLLQDYSLSNKE